MIPDNFPIWSSILKSLAANILHRRQGLHIKLFIRSWVDSDVEADVASEQMRPGSSRIHPASLNSLDIHVQGQIGYQNRVATQPRWAMRLARYTNLTAVGGDSTRFSIALKRGFFALNGGFFPLTP